MHGLSTFVGNYWPVYFGTMTSILHWGWHKFIVKFYDLSKELSHMRNFRVYELVQIFMLGLAEVGFFINMLENLYESYIPDEGEIGSH